ncbi:Cobyrinic acid a,c-diamide synthase [Desulfamplus magnetovallimortis]|uniref:Cobyrinic acid a,c-diamide synthase n=1 Tax=Desulfamplus magnetovallimortis TaxID=1246637 RepID=A0A1W1H9M8_9BACT|nr:ParA family protein [Desulfamplus magnetovallimortis]SLM29146.1 Cobyrinic acid a,c-diamide synthase [Desulfamplus magnetovallimortis]
MKTIAFYNVKGGVGKTTSCVNIAALCAADGYRTLLWDMDPQGAASFYLGQDLIEVKKADKVLKDKKQFLSILKTTSIPNLNIAPAFFNLRNMDIIVDDEKKAEKKLAKVMGKIAKSHDYLFIDCPPSISALSEMIFSISNLLIIPVIPTILSIQSLNQIREHLSTLRQKPEILFFFNMLDSRKKMHRETMEKCAHDPTCLSVSIPYRSLIEQMGIHQKPLIEFAPDEKETLAFVDLWKELKQRI